MHNLSVRPDFPEPFDQEHLFQQIMLDVERPRFPKKSMSALSSDILHHDRLLTLQCSLELAALSGNELFGGFGRFGHAESVN